MTNILVRNPSTRRPVSRRRECGENRAENSPIIRVQQPYVVLYLKTYLVLRLNVPDPVLGGLTSMPTPFQIVISPRIIPTRASALDRTPLPTPQPRGKLCSLRHRVQRLMTRIAPPLTRRPGTPLCAISS